MNASKQGIRISISLLLILFTSFVRNTEAQSQAFNDSVYYPDYHFYPSIDPTGLFYFGGQYYLNWGTAASTDLVHWKITDYGLERNKMTLSLFGKHRVPNPFGSDNSFFRSSVIDPMSGSAVIDWNNTSGQGRDGFPPIIGIQGNCSFSNDTAKSWAHYHEEPMVFEMGLNTHRDPKVFWYEPDKKWIRVEGWCEIYKIKFFSSTDLKEWHYMSEFGPWGAADGQWECSDFLQMPVDGDSTNMKWVLMVNDQPRSGEYFIGDFDGTRFTMDQAFVDDLTYDRYMPKGDMLFDFERGLDGWKIEGDAFTESPSEFLTHGREGRRCINSSRGGGFLPGPSSGKITSPEFTVTRRCINFLVGGDFDPGKECVNLLVDGKVVRTQTGNGGNSHMTWTGWDVAEFIGKKARIEIVDAVDGGFGTGNGWGGNIFCDAVMQCDELPVYKYNYGWDDKAFWIDWGQDLYATRAWSNYAPGDKRKIWVGWLGNWTYTAVEPVLGPISVPRSLELKRFPEGIRLVQNPIKELETLRAAHKVAEGKTLEGVWEPGKFRPGKNSYELIIEFENLSAGEYGVNLCVGGDQKTVVGYNVSGEELYVDRRSSGYDEFSTVFPGISRGPMKNRTGITKLHIYVDKCSVEVFGNDGETTITSKIYPDPGSTGITLFSNNGKVRVRRVELWELSPINLY